MQPGGRHGDRCMLLHACANPAHERRVGELIAGGVPDAESRCPTSSRVPRVRARSDAVNAYACRSYGGTSPDWRTDWWRWARRRSCTSCRATAPDDGPRGAEQSVRTMLMGRLPVRRCCSGLTGRLRECQVDMGGIMSFDICPCLRRSLRFTKESEIGPADRVVSSTSTLGAGGGRLPPTRRRRSLGRPSSLSRVPSPGPPLRRGGKGRRSPTLTGPGGSIPPPSSAKWR